MDLTALPSLRVAALDLNGQWRGKRVPGSYAEKLNTGAIRLPFSALNVDLWGRDITGSPLVFDSGDADGLLLPTGRGPVPMPWLPTPSAFVPMSLYHEGRTPFAGDPRHALSAILDRYAAHGWRVEAATEMEFTLVDDSGQTLSPPKDPRNGQPLALPDVVGLATLDIFDAFFTELYAACTAMDLPAQTAISEGGIGQFEMTLTHQDALKAADDAVLFKDLARGLARKHGMAATFMAKPYAEDAGNGMHVHFSVWDQHGRNIFDDGSAEGSAALTQAVAGCLSAMAESTLIFAPHANSYARMAENSHAPTQICWGYENRTAAIRIPGGSPKARRIEHRVAGGDINPYLMLASVLGAALLGIEEQMTPPAPIQGNAYAAQLPKLAPDWQSAIDSFEAGPMIARILPGDLIRNLVLTKRQELQHHATLDDAARWRSLLERV